MSRSEGIQRSGSTWQQLTEILGSALTLALIVYAALVALLQAEYGMDLDTDFRVLSLLPGGPAERAGIQLDDLVVGINGYPIDAWHLPILRWHPGDTLNVKVERDGRHLIQTIELEERSLSRRWEVVWPIVVAVSFWITSSLMPGLARQDFQARLFRAFSLVGSAVLAAGSLSGVSLGWAGRLFGILSGLLAPLILHFHISLPGARLERGRRAILLVAYSLGAIVALPFLAPEPVMYWWRVGWGSRGLRITLGAALLTSVIWLIVKYFTTGSLEVRRRLRLLVLGTVWGFFPVLSLSLLPDALGIGFVPYHITFSFLVLIPITYWYAATRFNLLRVDLILNRSLVYLTLTFILVGTYLLIMHLFALFLPDMALYRELVGALLLAAVGLIGLPLRNLIQRAVDRSFYGGWYDYRSVVSGISHRLTGTLDRHTLEELILEQIAGILWVRGAALLLPEPPAAHKLKGRQSGDFCIAPELLALEANGMLARQLNRIHQPVETVRLRQELAAVSLDPAESALLAHEAIRWWVPMVSPEGLVGLLLLGARLGNEQFDAQDLQILTTLGDQAALAIKNILLVEELRLQLEKIESSHRVLEKMHQQLLLGREEERKRLARDLHDGPVQQLIAVRYQLSECLNQTENPQLHHILNGLRDEAGMLLHELRDLCSQLRPPLLDTFGLASAIRSHSEETSLRHGLHIQTHLSDDESRRLPEEIAAALFRIYQEALSNVLKHANATEVIVRLHQTPSHVTLEVQDNGCGFVVPEPMDLSAGQERFGLLGIRERVELLKGKFHLVSEPGKGTFLRVWVPISSGDSSDNPA